MVRTFFILGGLFAGLAVAFGAFGAHALSGMLDSNALNQFEIGVRYQMYHSLALLAASWALARWESNERYFKFAGWLYIAGIILFSGSLYALSLSGFRWLGAITPFGGVAFVMGWAALTYGAWRKAR